MKKSIAILVGFLLLVSALGCGIFAPKNEKRLTIFVPCSIFAAFCEILDAYKKDNPDVRVSFDTGNSVVLMRKVLHKNARPDVYIGTGPLEIESLIDKGIIDATTKTEITADSIILVTPSLNPRSIKNILDLARSDVKSIAIPEPSVNSSGKYAVSAFKRLGLWDSIKDKVIFTEFGRHTRNYIMQNKVDAGILYRSCLYEDLKAYEDIIAPKEIFVVSDILKGSGEYVPSYIGILKSSKDKKLAKEFVDYMISSKSKAILKKWEGKEIAGK